VAIASTTRTLPWSWYTDTATLELERDALFRRHWQYVGHAGEVAKAGSFVSTRVGHVPVVVTRDEHGELRAFLNVCRHRGSLVCDGAGERATLQCPYHAWTYALDGRLIAAPRFASEGGTDESELGLVPLRLESWGPFLFVCADDDTPPLAEVLEDVPERIASAGIDVDSLRFLQRAELEIDANWKIVVENFLECYHCPTAHPGFSAVMDVSPGSYLLETHAWRMTQHGPPRPEPKGSYDPAGEVERGQFHLFFPGTVLNVMPGKPNLSIGPIFPLAPERTYRFLDYFVDPEADDAWIAEMLEFDTQVGEEDRALVERVQAGVGTGLLDQGRLMPESEQLIAHFQSLVLDALA
jgi:phenylpropionate dioxygenase-like ring-hydroxylating dioxygenase large terminal subunit